MYREYAKIVYIRIKRAEEGKNSCYFMFNNSCLVIKEARNAIILMKIFYTISIFIVIIIIILHSLLAKIENQTTTEREEKLENYFLHKFSRIKKDQK